MTKPKGTQPHSWSHLLEEGSVKNALLRTTITLLEETLQPYLVIQRCHRAFLVNISHVTNVEGNMQGFSLSLKYINNEIPVSRTYTKRIKDTLQ